MGIGVVHVHVHVTHVLTFSHNVGMFSIMHLGPERGVGVAITKDVATEQQDCGTCINYWEIVCLNL